MNRGDDPIEITHKIKQLLHWFFTNEDFEVIRYWYNDINLELWGGEELRFRGFELDDISDAEEGTVSLIFDQFLLSFNYKQVDIVEESNGEWQIRSTIYYKDYNNSNELFRQLSRELEQMYGGLPREPESKMPGYHLRF